MGDYIDLTLHVLYIPVLVYHVKDAGKVCLDVLAGHRTIPVILLTRVEIFGTLDFRLAVERSRGRSFAGRLVLLEVSLDRPSFVLLDLLQYPCVEVRDIF